MTALDISTTDKHTATSSVDFNCWSKSLGLFCQKNLNQGQQNTQLPLLPIINATGESCYYMYLCTTECITFQVLFVAEAVLKTPAIFHGPLPIIHFLYKATRQWECTLQLWSGTCPQKVRKVMFGHGKYHLFGELKLQTTNIDPASGYCSPSFCSN